MKYIDILSVTLVILISLMISCNGKSQEKVVHIEDITQHKPIDSLVKECPIQQMKEEMDSISIKLEKIKIEIKKRRKIK